MLGGLTRGGTDCQGEDRDMLKCDAYVTTNAKMWDIGGATTGLNDGQGRDKDMLSGGPGPSAIG